MPGKSPREVEPLPDQIAPAHEGAGPQPLTSEERVRDPLPAALMPTTIAAISGASRSQRQSDLPKLFSLKRLAVQLDVSERSVRRLVDQGEIAHVRVGSQIRISADDVTVYLARNRIEQRR